MKEEKRIQIAGILLAVGMTIILAGAVLPFLGVKIAISRWVLAGGALLALIARFTEPTIPAEKSFRLARLQKLDKMTAALFAIAAACLFAPEGHIEIQRAWIPVLMAAAVMQIYCTFVEGREIKKLQKQEQEPKSAVKGRRKK